jgi:prophage DNA circulation protein
VPEMEEPENRPYEHPETEPTPDTKQHHVGSGFIRDAAAAQTTVTTVHGFYRTAVDTQSEAGCTETSYAPTESTSANIPEAAQMRVPKIPDEEKVDRGEPIQCPYCFLLVAISGRRSWT